MMYTQQNYQQPMQQPQMQQQRPTLNEGSGVVIESHPKFDMTTGQPKTGQTQKGEMWTLYKIKIQTQNGQPSFSYFHKDTKPAPQIGNNITFKYSERPNPHGEGAPMKTIAFWNLVEGQQPQQPVNSFQGVNTQQQSAQVLSSQPQQPDEISDFISQYKNSVRQNGQQPDEAHALGTYLLQKLSDRPTTIKFRTTWSSIQ